MTEHDEQCESEFIAEAGLPTSCECDIRAAHIDRHRTCQNSDGPVRFAFSHWPDHTGMSDRVYVSCPHHGMHVLPNDRWTVQSIHPLTITPSIHWTDCGCHGFITNGEWIPA